jgi:hypothetical protein
MFATVISVVTVIPALVVSLIMTITIVPIIISVIPAVIPPVVVIPPAVVIKPAFRDPDLSAEVNADIKITAIYLEIRGINQSLPPVEYKATKASKRVTKTTVHFIYFNTVLASADIRQIHYTVAAEITAAIDNDLIIPAAR